MKKMKKMICATLAVLMLICVFSGCDKTDAMERFKAKNEIFTYEVVDPEKTTLIVSRTGNIDAAAFLDEFEAINQDIQVIYIDITGGNAECRPAIDWVMNGCAPDIMITTSAFISDEEAEEYYVNLSVNPVIENFVAEALQRTSINANVYRLPGPSNINCMVYNKTLFTQYGWKVPNTFDEFIDLCNQIKKDTNGKVQPWNPNAKYSNELITAIEAFVYEETLGGVDNRAWFNDYLEGNANFAGHMEPYFNVLQRLIDNGILREEHFTYSATTRGKEFRAGEIAMINSPITDFDNEEFDFGYMSFPTTKGKVGYVNDTYSCYVSIPKKENSEEVQDAIDRFLRYFSTPEGQQVLIGSSMKISNVKNVPLNQSDDFAALKETIEAGHLFEYFDFSGGQYIGRANLYQLAFDMTSGEKSVADCIAEVDSQPRERAEKEQPEQPEIIARAENLTILETSFYIADCYREKANADIGLIVNNEAYRGNLMRIFPGEITAAFVNVLKPRSFENDSTLVKVSMTGAQLLEALNHPFTYEDAESNSVYAYSGLKCEIAPWRPLGEKYISVTLADGSAIEPEKLYSVAIWDGTVSAEYITEVTEAFEGSFEDIITAKMLADGVVAPANDGRVTLVWD